METNNWPSWLQQLWPTWLEGIGYPAPGVGDLGDLKLVLGVGENGRWVGFVNPGWFYHDNKEQYHYVQVGTTTVSGASGSGSVTESISFRPSWGPVLAKGIVDDGSETDDGPYREHHNSFYPAATLTWSPASSGLYVANLPASTILVGMRDLTTLPLGSVAGTGLILSTKLYHTNGSQVWIKPASGSIQVYADLMYTVPKLRFRELVIQEDAGVLPSYQQINGLIVSRGSQTYTLSGYTVSGYITHTLSGVNNGDWVVLDYFISRSFILTAHNTLQYYVGGVSGSAHRDSFTINYETSIPTILPAATINDTVSGTFNINPLYENSYRVGYLFHANPASAWTSYWSPTKFSMYFDKTSVCGTWGELAKLTIIGYADNDLPVPYFPVTVTVSGGSGIIQMPIGTLDGRGEAHFWFKPTISASSLSVTGTMGSLTQIATASILASGSIVTLDKWIDGHVNMILTNEKTRRGAFKLLVNATNLDGVPRAANGIAIDAELASEFHNADSISTGMITIDTAQSAVKPVAIAEVGYAPQPKDRIVASVNDAQSIIVRSDD